MILIIMGNIFKKSQKLKNTSLNMNLLDANITSEYEDSLYNLSVNYNQLLIRVQTLENNSVTNIKTLSTDLHYLNDKYKSLDKKNEPINNKLESFDNKLESLDDKIESFDDKIESLDDNIESIMEANKMLVKRLDN